MLKKNILVAVMMLGVVGVANAGESHPVVAPAAQTCPIHGSVSLGYVNNYEYRGLVATNALAENGGLVYGANLYYQTKCSFKVVADFTFRDMSFSDLTGETSSKNLSKQTNLFAGVSDTFLGGSLTGTLGYNFTRGGLPGLAAMDDHLDGSDEQSHEVWAGMTFHFGEKIGIPGLFYQVSSAYCFSGNVGWWLGNTLGYERAINDCVKYVVAVNAGASYSYWMNGTDGWDQANLSFALPISPGNNFEIAPYISLNWGAHNVEAINKAYLERGVAGKDLLENFAIIAGVKATYNF